MYCSGHFQVNFQDICVTRNKSDLSPECQKFVKKVVCLFSSPDPKGHVRYCKIYLACNFKVNLITHPEVIALFSSNFKNVITFHPLFQKL